MRNDLQVEIHHNSNAFSFGEKKSVKMSKCVKEKVNVVINKNLESRWKRFLNGKENHFLTKIF